MNPQYTNKVISSFLLWMDHTLLDDGGAWENSSGFFFAVDNQLSSRFTYAVPYKPLAADSAIVGMTVMTGVFLDTVLVGTGISGLLDIDYERGQVYFTGEIAGANRVSGNFAIKEFRVALTSKSEDDLLFETKFLRRNKVSQTLSGLREDEETFPAIFLKNNGGNNRPFAFGGTDESFTNIRAIVIADSQFTLDAVTSVMKDKARTWVALVEGWEMPFNANGGLRTGAYNYNTLESNKIPNSGLFIDDVSVLTFDRGGGISQELKKVNPSLYPAIVDFRLIGFRKPRA